MTAQTNEAQWYIARDGKQHGPLTDVEMRTFVGHNYLRPSDLLWRPGMADWQPAPQLFPQAFQQPAPPPQQQMQPRTQPGMAPQPQTSGGPASQGAGANPYGRQQQHPGAQNPGVQNPGAQTGGPRPGAPFGQGAAQPQTGAPNAGAAPDENEETFEEERPRRGIVRQAVLALGLVALIGGGAYAVVAFKGPVMQILSGPPKKAAAPVTAETAPAPNEQPSLAEAEATGPDASQIAGSALDARLQKVPLWEMLKKAYPEWYIGSVAGADKLTAEKKSQSDVMAQLTQDLVNLRRQNAPSALAASPEKLRSVAMAFLENLRALQAQSVDACYGFISKGEMSPAIINLMQSPETATALNAQLTAIFEAAAEGAKSPINHEAAGKADYDVLIAELSKLGWKDDDLQTFSNPRLLAKREPAQVCKMVQDWFSAHLAVGDAAAQERLLYETLKPVVSG